MVYSSDPELNNNENSEHSVLSTIASNVFCNAVLDLSAPNHTWECSAFAEGTDFSRFLQEVEDSNMTCLLDGAPPIFKYRYCEKGGESCTTFPDCREACITEVSTEFNATLAYQMHSFYFNVPSKNDDITTSASGFQVAGFGVEQKILIVATIMAASFILLFL